MAATDMIAEQQRIMTENILARVVENELQPEVPDVAIYVPETEPVEDECERMITQTAVMVHRIGDLITEQHGEQLADTFDGVGNLLGKNPEKLPDFFKDLFQQSLNDKISWGRIAMLFYTVGKIAKMLVISGPNRVREMLSQAVGYLRENVVGWIIKMGGWMCSIAAIAEFRITNVPLVTPPKPTSEGAIALTYLTSGMVLGGILVFWIMSRTKQ